MKKTLILLTVLILTLSGCAERIPNTNIKVSPSDRNICDIVTTVYSDAQIQDIAEMPFQHVNELNDQYPVECVRVFQYGYFLYYYGESTVVRLSCDFYGEDLNSSQIYTMDISSKELETLEIGTPATAVLALQPTFPKEMIIDRACSGHYTTDGYYVFIQYERNDAYPINTPDSMTVSRITKTIY